MSLSDRLRSFDQLQRRRPRLAFVVAVLKKYSDDSGPQLAALIAYYAFFSFFPLLLIAVTVLGYVLQGDATLQHDIVNSFVRDIPVIGQQIQDNVRSLKGSGVALAVGLITSLWAGLGITQAVQSSFNRIWHVPYRNRPDFLRARLRGVVLLLALGGLTLASTGATGVVSAGSSGSPLVGFATIAISLALNVAIFLTAFNLLTSTDLELRTLLPGAVVAGIFWELLQTGGTLLATHWFKHLNATYGTFALVLALLSLLYLGAQVMLISAEMNVVLKQRLWPRGLMHPLTTADKRALIASAEMEERVDQEDVNVAFD